MGLKFSELKTKQRKIRSDFPKELGLCVHRCLSWLNRAEQAGDDGDAVFIFLWISFNAAYAEEITDYVTLGERSDVGGILRRCPDIDSI